MTASAREVVEKVLRAGRERDFETVLGLMAPEGYDARGTVVPTGSPFEQTVIAVFRVRDGQILSHRDYVNPLPVVEAMAAVTAAQRR